MRSVQLIRRENCGLCMLAADLLAQIPALGVQERYLEDDPELADHYGWRIPVVRIGANDRELDWPFDLVKLQEFLQQD